MGKKLGSQHVLVPDDADSHHIHGRHHAQEVLVCDDDHEVGLVEDVVPLLSTAFQAVVLVIQCPSHRKYYIIILTLCLPLGANISVEVHIVDGLVDGDVRKSARLLSLNSCSGNFQLKTLLRTTETVMVDKREEDKDEMRKWSSF